MYGYVYITTNKINNKIYIGQHKSAEFDSSYYGSGKLFYKAFQKYGKDNFDCQILESCESKSELDEREKYFIKLYNSQNPDIGYNLADGGNSWDCGYHMGMLGKSQSDKQKQAVSRALKGVKKSDEAKLHMSISKIGNTNAKNGKGKKFINNGVVNKRVPEEQLQTYIEQGWVRGKVERTEEQKQNLKELYSHKTYIYKDSVIRHVDNNDLQEFLNDGWQIGRPQKDKQSTANKISSAKKGSICITDGVRNYYVDPNNLSQYKNKGFYKCSIYKYEKLKLEETPCELMENLLIK